MTRSVLLICYYFPPLGMGGIMRPLSLFKKLPEHDWECHVLTVKPVLYRAYEPELLASLDKKKIFRSGSRDPQRLLYLLGMRRIKGETIDRTRNVSGSFFPDPKIGWVKPAVRLGMTLCDNYRYQCVISTAPPISTHLVGMRLAAEFGVPWVADFRDYWTAYRADDTYTDSHLVDRAHALLTDIRKQAKAVTAVSESVSEYVQGDTVIRNGFDVGLAEGWKAPPSRDEFIIGMLGHQTSYIEIDCLLKTLAMMRQRNAHVLNDVRLIQVGQIEPDWLNGKLQSFGLDIPVDFHGRQPRERAVEILSKAHLLYFGVHVDDKNNFLPGKTFDLLASGRPLLTNVNPPTEIGKVLSGSSMTHFIDAHNIEFTAEYVERLIAEQKAGEYRIEPLSGYSLGFTTDAMVGKFAQLLDKTV
jgi:glycosyltransferase involved in cell wall biosynthesis